MTGELYALHVRAIQEISNPADRRPLGNSNQSIGATHNASITNAGRTPKGEKAPCIRIATLPCAPFARGSMSVAIAPAVGADGRRRGSPIGAGQLPQTTAPMMRRAIRRSTASTRQRQGPETRLAVASAASRRTENLESTPHAEEGFRRGDQGAWSTKSTAVPATRARIVGAWTAQEEKRRCRIAARRCGKSRRQRRQLVRREHCQRQGKPARVVGTNMAERPARPAGNGGAAASQGQI